MLNILFVQLLFLYKKLVDDRNVQYRVHKYKPESQYVLVVHYGCIRILQCYETAAVVKYEGGVDFRDIDVQFSNGSYRFVPKKKK